MANAFTLASEISLNYKDVVNGLNEVDKKCDDVADGLKKTEGAADSSSNKWSNLAKTVAGYVSATKIIDFGKDCIEGANTQIQAETKLEQAFRATGKASDSEVQSLKEHASALQKVGVIGDEVTMAGMSQLATFNLNSESVKILTAGMQDLAVNMNGVNVTSENMQSIANLVGKVMTGNTSALSRYGITLDENQEKLLKEGDEMQRASTLADILSQNVGGMNEALAQTPEGKATQLANDWGDLKEMLGNALLPALSKVVGWIQKLVDWFNNLSPGMQKAIIIGTVVVGVLGLIFSAVTSLVGGLATLGVTVNLAFLPWVALIAAVVAAVVLLWNKCEWFREGVKAIWEAIKDAFKAVWDWIVDNFKRNIAIMKIVIDALKNAWDSVCNFFSNAWEKVTSGIKAVFQGVRDTVVGIAQGMVNTVIGAINWCIKALNKLSFKVPKWVPGIGGKKFGFDIKEIKEVNWLYDGAIFNAPTQLGAYGVGDAYNGKGKQSEAVVPIDKLKDMIRDVLTIDFRLDIDGREFVTKVVAPYQDELVSYGRGR